MKSGIMQPYFVPYIGYFSLIKNTDKWIILDTVQYIRHGWINRNRILKPSDDWQYITIPLEKHSRSALIKDIKIKENTDWRDKIFKQLEHYKKKAPFYKETIKLLKECFEHKTESIVDLNTHLLKKICEYLDIKFKYKIFSEMDLKIGEIKEPGDWALEISKALGASEYINPPGGEEIFNKKKFIKEKIELKFLKINLEEYDQRRNKFKPGLSIIDVMMFNDPRTINKFLDNYKLYE